MMYPVISFLKAGSMVILLCMIGNQVSALRLTTGTSSSKNVNITENTSSHGHKTSNTNFDNAVVESDENARSSKLSGLFESSNYDFEEKDTKDRNKFSREATIHRNKRQLKRLSKKSKRKHDIEIKKFQIYQKSCPTQSAFSQILKAVDIFGDMVDVVPTVTIGDYTNQQLFYEKYCHTEKCACGGINKKKYHSTCESTHGFTFAMVVKEGKKGWNYIKVRTGCHCVIQKHGPQRMERIHNLLHRDIK